MNDDAAVGNGRSMVRRGVSGTVRFSTIGYIVCTFHTLGISGLERVRVAGEFVKKLSGLIAGLGFEDQVEARLEVRHFFSGAALYAYGQICASWSPAGLTFRLSEQECCELIASGRAIPLRYFPGGHIKKEYALFENAEDRADNQWKEYFARAISGRS